MSYRYKNWKFTAQFVSSKIFFSLHIRFCASNFTLLLPKCKSKLSIHTYISILNTNYLINERLTSVCYFEIQNVKHISFELTTCKKGQNQLKMKEKNEMRSTNTFTRKKYRKYKNNAPNIKDKVYYKDTYCAVNFQT